LLQKIISLDFLAWNADVQLYMVVKYRWLTLVLLNFAGT